MSPPQRLKPDSVQSIYARPEGRTLQKNESFRKPTNATHARTHADTPAGTPLYIGLV